MQIVKKQMLPKLTHHIEKYCYRHMVTGAFWCLPCFGHCKMQPYWSNFLNGLWQRGKLCATNISTQHDNFNLRVLAIYTIMSFCGNMYNIAIFGNQSNIAIFEWHVQHAMPCSLPFCDNHYYRHWIVDYHAAMQQVSCVDETGNWLAAC